MVYNSQRGRGFNDIFGTLNRTFKPVIESVADVGANVATGLVSDLLSGKTAKTSIKERGNQAKGMVAQRALQVFRAEAGQNVNEAVQKVNPRRNVNKQEDVFFLPLYIIPVGIILATI